MATSSKRKWNKKKAEELALPSGNVALVKRPGMETFLTEGLIPDRLMPIITESINKGKGLPPAKVKELIDDPSAVASMFDAMDRVLCAVVVEPNVLWHKEFKDGATEATVIPESQRDDDDIYTDDVDFEDKSFIFNYAVGGTGDLERFRSESDASVASLQSGEEVEQPTE